MVYFGTRLSENMSLRQPEGYLICLNVPVARTGVQEYLPSELGLPEADSRMIAVRRPEEEVFSPACMASFEGMPVTDDHPRAAEGVTAENSRGLQKGHAHHIRRGTGENADLLMADLIITDPGLIQEIRDGKREISCGYSYRLCREDGEYIQRDIRGNHVAVVDSGRAGPRVSIRDAKGPEKKRGAKGARDERSKGNMNRQNNWPARLMVRMAKDGDTEGLTGLINEIMAEAPAEAPGEEAPVVVETPVEQPVVIDCGAEILEALRQIIGLMSAGARDCDAPEKAGDEEAEAEATETAAEAPEAAGEAAAEAAGNLAEAAAQAVAVALAPEEAGDEDPVEALVAEILEGDGEEAGAAGEEQEEILSSILEPAEADEEAEAETEEESARAADALRAALASFRPQLRKMSPRDRQLFNRDVATRMRALERRAGDSGRGGVYAALRKAGAQDSRGRSLGEKIMAERNVNRKR